MREKSIIFSVQEVMDALAGLKIQKRIPFKNQPPSGEYVLATCLSATRDGRDIAKYRWVTVDGLRIVDGKQPYFSCPWKIGDQLWVRETWADTNGECGPMISYRANGDLFLISDSYPVDYSRYPGCNFTMWAGDLRRGEHGHSWRPAVHMPRWASRITMTVASVRFEKKSPVAWVIELEVDSIK
jgi:hypothetical protein